ncbi:hypothetical protein K438DRAFT_1606011 [Mycena galopus ATCC 62051]|nr:hypothetical protein K438DRAFT_1606011 [Mycena galopus ATCC 62051]
MPLPLLSQSLTYVTDDHSELLSLAQPFNTPVIIFTSSQPQATSPAQELVLNGVFIVNCLHAGMTKKEQEEAVSLILRGESLVMISTEVMERGMDFKGVQNTKIYCAYLMVVIINYVISL